ncbi:MAG: hypothetical protein ABJB39_09045 [Chloroflexota bacterium]
MVLSLAVGIAYLFLGAAWPLALGAGVLVYTLKLALELPWRPYQRRLPAPDPGSPEAFWLQRAANAVRSIKELRRSARSESIADRCAAIAIQAEASVGTLQRLVYQASVVSGIARSRDVTGAQIFYAQSARNEAAERLESTRRELHERIEASVLGLEGLVARLAQIVALSEAGGEVASMDELAFELDSLRAALVETEELGRSSMHALSGPNEKGGQ